MKKLLEVIGIGIAAIALLISLLLVASRFSDGPLVEMLPGGPFKTGEIVTEGPNDWGFLAERMTVEFQSDGRSRITWIHILEGNAYIGASLGFPPFKTWHESALKDPTAVLRIDGNLSQVATHFQQTVLTIPIRIFVHTIGLDYN